MSTLTVAANGMTKREFRRWRHSVTKAETPVVDPVYAAADARVRWFGDQAAEMLARPMPTLIEGVGFVWPDDPNFDALITRPGL